MPDPNTDQYSIEIKNLTTGETVILTAVEMTDEEKNVVVRQLLRLSGAPAALWIEDDEPKKPFQANGQSARPGRPVSAFSADAELPA